MFIWNLDPVAFSLGPLQVYWYGIVYALGFLFGYFILRYAARHHLVENLTEQLAEEYILQLAMASVLLARVWYVVFYNPVYYWNHWLEIPAVWHGGLSIHGGLLGAILVTWLFCRKHKINFYKLVDVLVVPLALVLVFGRLANFVNGELWGRETTVSWCVVFPGADGCRHPSQIYEAIYSFVLFLILFSLQRTKKFVDGFVFWSFLTLYGLFRFIVTFYREFDSTDPAFLSLSLGQWFSLLMMIVGLSWFYLVWKTKHPFTKKR